MLAIKSDQWQVHVSCPDPPVSKHIAIAHLTITSPFSIINKFVKGGAKECTSSTLCSGLLDGFGKVMKWCLSSLYHRHARAKRPMNSAVFFKHVTNLVSPLFYRLFQDVSSAFSKVLGSLKLLLLGHLVFSNFVVYGVIRSNTEA